MSSNEDFEITGLSELADVLEKLPANLAAKAVRPALNAAGQVFEAAMHTTVPKDTGALDQSITHKVHVSANLSDMSVIVGPRYSGGGTQDPGVRGKFLELGTRKMAPRFWMRRAFEMSKDAAYDAAVTVLKGVLDQLKK